MRQLDSLLARLHIPLASSPNTSLVALAPRSIERGFLRVMGIGLITLGVCGLVPAFAPHGRIAGLFAGDAPHNALHTLLGAAALVVARMPKRAHAWTGTALLAITCGLLSIFGFAQRGAILGIARTNAATNLLYLFIALAALVVAMIAEYGRLHPSATLFKARFGRARPKKSDTDTPPTTSRRSATA